MRAYSMDLRERVLLDSDAGMGVTPPAREWCRCWNGQRGQYLRLALEPRQPVRVGCECFRQHLQRDVPVELGIAGTVDLAHPAPPADGYDSTDTELLTGCEAHDLGVLRGTRHAVARPHHVAGAGRPPTPVSTLPGAAASG